MLRRARGARGAEHQHARAGRERCGWATGSGRRRYCARRPPRPAVPVARRDRAAGGQAPPSRDPPRTREDPQRQAARAANHSDALMPALGWVEGQAAALAGGLARARLSRGRCGRSTAWEAGSTSSRSGSAGSASGARRERVRNPWAIESRWWRLRPPTRIPNARPDASSLSSRSSATTSRSPKRAAASERGVRLSRADREPAEAQRLHPTGDGPPRCAHQVAPWPRTHCAAPGRRPMRPAGRGCGRSPAVVTGRCGA